METASQQEKSFRGTYERSYDSNGGTDNTWEYYDNVEFEAGNYNLSFRLQYDGMDTIVLLQSVEESHPFYLNYFNDLKYPMSSYNIIVSFSLRAEISRVALSLIPNK